MPDGFLTCHLVVRNLILCIQFFPIEKKYLQMMEDQAKVTSKKLMLEYNSTGLVIRENQGKIRNSNRGHYLSSLQLGRL